MRGQGEGDESKRVIDNSNTVVRVKVRESKSVRGQQEANKRESIDNSNTVVRLKLSGSVRKQKAREPIDNRVKVRERT